MKKILVIISIVFVNVLFSINVFASDNVFVGSETVEEVYGDIDIILEESSASYKDGEITLEDLNFERTQKIFVDTLPYFFNEKTVTASSLKELIDNLDYVYYMPIFREHETVFLTIAKGLELSESDYELLEQVSAPDDAIAELERDIDRWCITGIGITDEPWDPSMDYIGKVDNYLTYKNIHNAEIYFVSRINPDSLISAVCFTGNKTESGEDEILFIAVDRLAYDESGQLVCKKRGFDDYYDVSEAEYTYEDLRTMNNRSIVDPEATGGGGGGLVKKGNYGVYAAIIAGVVVIAVVIVLITKKKLQR